jgi:hypothetical protein
MSTRRHRRPRPIEELRRAIDCLPVRTREAMLSGIAGNERVIVGAYVDGEGGVCPMLAAHRCGGRTDLLSFARSWDRFARAGRRARRATGREVGILVGQLQASLLAETAVELGGAIAEHRELRVRHERARAADPTGEIVARRLDPAGGIVVRGLGVAMTVPGRDRRRLPAASGQLRKRVTASLRV